VVIGSIYAGVKLFLPVCGLTGYYFYFTEKEENVELKPLAITSKIHTGLKKKVYRGHPKGKPIEEKREDVFAHFNWSSESQKPYNSPFTIEWDGLLKIKHQGRYTFFLSSDDGSKLFINGEQIINNWGAHAVRKKEQTVFLKPGFYHIYVKYFDQGGGAVMSLKWRDTEGRKTSIPPDQLYHATDMKNIAVYDTAMPDVLRIQPTEGVQNNKLVFKKNSPSITFGNYGILRTFYVNYWDNDKFKPPGDIPPYNILWRGRIRIPEDGDYLFRADTNGDVFLFINKMPVIKYCIGSSSNVKTHLNKGWHPIQINYHNTARFAGLKLLWQKPEDHRLSNISQTYLRPSEERSVFGAARIWFALGFIIAPVSAIVCFIILWRKRLRRYVSGYGCYVKQNWFVVSLIAIVILGAVLRLNNYSVIPSHGETMDVYQEAWNGYHILNGEGPKSWLGSYFASASKPEEKNYFRWLGDGFLIVERYLGHPPLFSIFAAIPPVLSGAKDFLDCRLTTINLTPVFFSTLTIILVFCVSYKIYRSHAIAIIASLIYATVPLVVASGRIAKGDGLLAFVLMAGVLCALHYTETKKKTSLILAGFLAGTAFWSKEPGLCALLIIPLILGGKGFRKEAYITLGIGGVIVAGYLLYSYLINAVAFYNLENLRTSHQTTKFNIVLKYLKEPKITMAYAPFGMGYLLWFWFVVVYSTGKKRNLVVPGTTFIYLMTLCAVSKYGQTFGWFMIPLYPFMAIAGGVFMRDFISRPNTARALLLLLLLIAVPLNKILPDNLHNESWLYRYYLVSGILPFLAYDFFRNRITMIIARAASYMYITLFIMMNVYIVYHLPEIYNPFR